MINNPRILKWLGVHEFSGATFARELMASVVVFLVALPLCMGIAIASGAPAALGLITGIVGGLVVGLFAGCRLQVSGPAAGLAVIVYELIQTHGLKMLGIIVLLGGAMQLVAGTLKLGQWFRAVSPAVIRGMLAGIGVLIFASQFHVMVDDKPRKGGLANLASIPEAVYKGIFPIDGSTHHLAALVGLLTLGALIGWNVLRPKQLKMIPGALIGVTVAAVATATFGWQINFVEVPDNLMEAANWVPVGEFKSLLNPQIWVAAITIAAVASAETLLCATAVDQLHDGPRADYDQELVSQGIGNMICGIFGALPMTGVIVRSSANVEAGAKTRLSAFFHGGWLLLFVAALPFVLQKIPTAALAGILVYIGYKLLNPPAILKMWRFSRAETAIFAVTLVGIVVTNLLTGIIMGIAASLLRQAWRLARLDINIEDPGGEEPITMHLRGTATFLTLPRLAKALEELPTGREIRIELNRLGYIDHACIELFTAWEKSRAAMGNKLILGWDEMFSRYNHGADPTTTIIEFQSPNKTDDKDTQAA